MKNTLKAIIGMTLALIMVFGSIPAFAAETGDTVLWDEGYEETFYEEHRYGGTLTEGTNHLTPFLVDEGSYCYYYEFDAENSGYYLVSNDAYFGELSDDGTMYYADYPVEWYLETDDGFYDVVYLEKGSKFIGLRFTDFEYFYEYIDVEIKYIDDEITDIVFDKKIVENLIINENVYLQDDNTFDIYDIDYTVVFSNGKELNIKCEPLCFEMKSEPVNGANTVYATFADYEKPVEATMYYIDYFVESIELSNVEDYLTAYEFYNGRYTFNDYNNEEITVNYTDGTSETIVYGDYEDEGQTRNINILGRECFISVWHSESSLTLEVAIADQTFAEYECIPVKANATTNRRYFEANLANDFERFVSSAGFYWERMWDFNGIEAFLSNAKFFIENFSRLTDMANEIGAYLRFAFV